MRLQERDTIQRPDLQNLPEVKAQRPPAVLRLTEVVKIPGFREWIDKQKEEA